PLQKPKNGALDSSTPPDLYTTRTFGYLLQYFAVGLVYGGLPATNYGLFICYLNVPAYVSSAATTLATFPWSVKILFAFATDGFPIGGYRRRPWMMIGWSICSIFLIALALTPLPPPYYCIEEGRLNLHKVCNPAAASSGFPFAVLLCLAACGYVAADVAADGLTVSYARREGLSTRGTTQTTAYLVRTFGQIGAQLLVGFGMNGPEYEGTFGAGLSFNAVCAILAVPSAAMIVISWVAIEEDRVGEDERRTVDGSGEKGKAVEEDVVHSPTSFVRTCWSLFESAAMLEVVLFQARHFRTNHVMGSVFHLSSHDHDSSPSFLEHNPCRSPSQSTPSPPPAPLPIADNHLNPSSWMTLFPSIFSAVSHWRHRRYQHHCRARDSTGLGGSAKPTEPTLLGIPEATPPHLSASERNSIPPLSGGW
ncbi:MAG: hypothetical protein SGPRY_010862, partial [Prymnesium sp.]